MKGQILIKLYKDQQPEVEFSGDVDVMDIQSSVYYLRMGFSVRMGVIGQELREKADKAKAQKDAEEQKELLEKAEKIKVEAAEKVLEAAKEKGATEITNKANEGEENVKENQGS